MHHSSRERECINPLLKHHPSTGIPKMLGITHCIPCKPKICQDMKENKWQCRAMVNLLLINLQNYISWELLIPKDQVIHSLNLTSEHLPISCPTYSQNSLNLGSTDNYTEHKYDRLV